jgi:hypothetical protein
LFQFHEVVLFYRAANYFIPAIKLEACTNISK